MHRSSRRRAEGQRGADSGRLHRGDPELRAPAPRRTLSYHHAVRVVAVVALLLAFAAPGGGGAHARAAREGPRAGRGRAAQARGQQRHAGASDLFQKAYDTSHEIPYLITWPSPSARRTCRSRRSRRIGAVSPRVAIKMIRTCVVRSRRTSTVSRASRGRSTCARRARPPRCCSTIALQALHRPPRRCSY